MNPIKTNLVKHIALKKDVELYEAGLNPVEITHYIQWGGEFKIVRSVSKLSSEKRMFLEVSDQMISDAKTVLGMK